MIMDVYKEMHAESNRVAWLMNNQAEHQMDQNTDQMKPTIRVDG